MGYRLASAGDLSFKHRGLLFPVALALLVIPGPALTDQPAVLGMAGFLLALIGEIIRIGTIGLAYIIRGGKDHHVYAETLVTRGLYAHCRNPMYLGNLLLLLGLALASNSWIFVLLGVPIAIGVHWTIVAAEERFLRDKFGSAFDAYCCDVPRLFPRLKGIFQTFQSMQFDWRRVLVNEFAKPVDWLFATALVVIYSLWRAGQLEEQAGVANLMLVFIGVRMAVWITVRTRGASRREGASVK